jgi:hypothetical protein
MGHPCVTLTVKYGRGRINLCRLKLSEHEAQMLVRVDYTGKIYSIEQNVDILILEGVASHCICYHDLFWGRHQSQQFLFSYFPFSRHYMFQPLLAILKRNIHSRF